VPGPHSRPCYRRQDAAMLKRPYGRARPSQSSENGEGQAPSFEKLVLSLAPSALFEEALAEALREVSDKVKQVFGQETFALPFGSIIQSAHLEGSDLDLCFDAPDVVAQMQEVPAGGKFDNSLHVAALRRIMGALQGKFRVIETRFFKHMKVPIIILGYRSSGGVDVEADISVGTVFEDVGKGHADRCIRRLLAYSPKALHMARVVKLWAKVEKLNKAYDGYLNSLGWAILVMYFCIQNSHVVVDYIHMEEPDERGRGGDTSTLPPLLHADEARGGFLSEDDLLPDVPSCGELADFFDWVACWESWWPLEPPVAPMPGEERKVWGMSIVDGDIIEVPAPSKTWADSCSLFVEDPGVRLGKGVSENVARSLKVAPWNITLRRSRAAAEELRAAANGDRADAARDWLACLVRESKAERHPVAPRQRFGPGAIGGLPIKRPWQPMAPAMSVRPPMGIVPPRQAAQPLPMRGGCFHEPAIKRPRVAVCSWFLKNECWDGDRCGFSHQV